ncbi:MAG TPA: shikimate dehydrogenase [Chitinophagaceae bacterium]|nr:shikimate dehydrogenase [Chitinophagaceae bacterium]
MRQFGLIGYPLGHSFSKQYFTEKFRKEGLADCSFEAYPLASIDEFPALLQNNPLLQGLSVTIPYKEQVLRHVTDLSEEVKQIGATNSIKIREDRLTAYNTDIIGFEQSFVPYLMPYHIKALILGTGGAAKAVQYVLRKLGINYLLVSRSEVPAAGVINYKQLDTATLAEHTIIINCSPAGMSPNEDTCPDIPYHLLTPGHYLYDLVYKPAKTLFLQRGEERGAAVQNGADMLIIQAEESWRIWNS